MEWGTSDVIALVAATGTILAVIVTGVSIWLNYLGSEKRLEHEKELQQAQLAEDRRKEGLDAAVKAYSLTAKVEDHTYFHNTEGWDDRDGLGSGTCGGGNAGCSGDGESVGGGQGGGIPCGYRAKRRFHDPKA